MLDQAGGITDKDDVKPVTSREPAIRPEPQRRQNEEDDGEDGSAESFKDQLIDKHVDQGAGGGQADGSDRKDICDLGRGACGISESIDKGLVAEFFPSVGAEGAFHGPALMSLECAQALRAADGAA